MYKIERPNTIHQLLDIFYRFGMWTCRDVTTFRENCRKLSYFIYFVSFFLSAVIGAYVTDDKDECIFLTVVSVILVVLAYRMWLILYRRNGFLLLLNEIGTHSTNDREEFIQINKKLNGLMKFVCFYLVVLAMGCIFVSVLFPMTTKIHVLNIAIPFDRNHSEIAFWVKSAFLFGGLVCAILCDILTKMVWYLMLNISIEYEILGSQLRRMGKSIRPGSTNVTNVKVSLAAQKQLFLKDLIAAIQTYDKINGYSHVFLRKRCGIKYNWNLQFRALKQFASYFGNLFFIQIATGSVCICGSVYTLAFVNMEFSIFKYFFVISYFAELTQQSDTRCSLFYSFGILRFRYIHGHVLRERNYAIQWRIVTLCVWI